MKDKLLRCWRKEFQTDGLESSIKVVSFLETKEIRNVFGGFIIVIIVIQLVHEIVHARASTNALLDNHRKRYRKFLRLTFRHDLALDVRAVTVTIHYVLRAVRARCYSTVNSEFHYASSLLRVNLPCSPSESTPTSVRCTLKINDVERIWNKWNKRFMR